MERRERERDIDRQFSGVVTQISTLMTLAMLEKCLLQWLQTGKNISLKMVNASKGFLSFL